MSDPSLMLVGELARTTGLTVRTLHHFDRIGLLRPGGRSDAGHRLYGPDDVARLYRIVALRSLGFRLDRIAALLSGGDDPRPVVVDQLRHVEQDLETVRRLHARLVAVKRVLDRHADPTTADFLHLIEETAMHRKTIEHVYTPEQLEWLAERREALGDDAIAAVEAEWPQLYARAQGELDAGTDPADPRLDAILGAHGRAARGVHRWSAGHPGIAGRLYADHGDEVRAAHGGPPPELQQFLGRARAARRGHGPERVGRGLASLGARPAPPRPVRCRVPDAAATRSPKDVYRDAVHRWRRRWPRLPARSGPGSGPTCTSTAAR
jgi:DNA-binding transcriptional MerR regulator